MVDSRADHPRFFCMECDVDTYANEQYYVLKDRLWKRIHPPVDGMLRLSCAEKRLGRPLSRRDFKDVPLNALQARVVPNWPYDSPAVPDCPSAQVQMGSAAHYSHGTILHFSPARIYSPSTR
jgi:hypothetical protein